jgi:hypothetical protein
MNSLLLLLACAQSDVPLAPDSVITDGGTWTLSLSPQPDPPVAGEAALVIGVTGAADSGTADSGTADPAAVSAVTLWMPAHNHGITDDVSITTDDDAATAVWTYTMSGYWEVTITMDDGEAAVVGYEVQ